MTPCLRVWMTCPFQNWVYSKRKKFAPFKMRSTLKGNNLLLGEQILFCKELTPIEKRGRKESDRVAFLEILPICPNMMF